MKRNLNLSSKPIYASQIAKQGFLFLIILIAVLIITMIGCKKEELQQKPIPYAILQGKYIKADTLNYSADTLTLVTKVFMRTGVCPNTWEYYFPYPVFSSTMNFSNISTTPISQVIALDDGERRDSIIPTLTDIGVISGRLNNDTLTLSIYRYSQPNTIIYKYRKIQ